MSDKAFRRRVKERNARLDREERPDRRRLFESWAEYRERIAVEQKAAEEAARDR